MYDPYFQGPRPYNKAVYKALFGDDILKLAGVDLYIAKPQTDLKLKVE
jgi:hypothetical protein